MKTMQAEVGKNADDRYAYRNHYRRLFVAEKKLSNGNIEEQYRGGRSPDCHVYFEIDRVARKIVNWRYEGSEDDCAITP
ncbi:MAG: hypothetical protein WA373_04820 [Burkholderiales bacterium]